MALPIPNTPTSALLPFVVAEKWIWLECDVDDDHTGFSAEVRLNLTNAERERLLLLVREVDETRQAIAARFDAKLKPLIDAKDAENADRLAIGGEIANLIDAVNAEHEANTARIREAIAPYIRAWNAAVMAEDGALIEAPPPRTAGVAAFAAVDQVMEMWLITSCLNAYRGGKGLTRSSTKPGASARPGSERGAETTKGRRRSTRPPVVS